VQHRNAQSCHNNSAIFLQYAVYEHDPATIRVTGKSRDESSNTYVQIVGFEVRGGNAEPGKRESD